MTPPTCGSRYVRALMTNRCCLHRPTRLAKQSFCGSYFCLSTAEPGPQVGAGRHPRIPMSAGYCRVLPTPWCVLSDVLDPFSQGLCVFYFRQYTNIRTWIDRVEQGQTPFPCNRRRRGACFWPSCRALWYVSSGKNFSVSFLP